MFFFSSHVCFYSDPMSLPVCPTIRLLFSFLFPFSFFFLQTQYFSCDEITLEYLFVFLFLSLFSHSYNIHYFVTAVAVAVATAVVIVVTIVRNIKSFFIVSTLYHLRMYSCVYTSIFLCFMVNYFTYLES